MTAGSEILDAQKLLTEVGVREGDHLADFGVGRSAYFALAGSRVVGSTGKVYAVDIQKDLLQMLDRSCALDSNCNIETIWGDYEGFCGVSIRPETLDYVFSIHNLWCTNDIGAMAEEAMRLLKSHGKLILIDWKHDAKNPIAPKLELRTDKKVARRKLIDAGFHIIDELLVNHDHWGFVVKKS